MDKMTNYSHAFMSDILPIAPRIQLVSRCRDIKRERRGMLYFSLIPCVGSRIALSQDKQLELAHAVIYSI